MSHRELLQQLCELHDAQIAKELKALSDVDAFFDFIQKSKKSAEKSHAENKINFKDHPNPHVLAWFDRSQFIADCERIQKIILGLQKEEKPACEMRCIALAYHLDDEIIDSQNASKIAAANGHTSETSGRKLQGHYNKLSDPIELKAAKVKYTEQDLKKVVRL